MKGPGAGGTMGGGLNKYVDFMMSYGSYLKEYLIYNFFDW